VVKGEKRMSITESFTFWAGKALFDVAITVVILAVILVVSYFAQDEKE